MKHRTLISPRIIPALLAFVSSLLTASVQAQEPEAVRPPIVVNIYDNNSVSIQRNAEYLLDGEHTLTLDDVRSLAMAKQFKQVETIHPNFGYTSNIIWLKISVKNTLSHPITRIIDVASQIVDSIAFYVPLSDGQYRQEWAGNAMFIDMRTMKRRRAVFELHLEANEQKTYYAQALGKNPFLFNLLLYTPEQFSVVEREDYTFYGVIWGIVLCMIAFNAALFAVTLNRLYIIAALHLTASLFALFAVAGVFGEMFWYDVPSFNTRVLSVSIFLANIFSLIFAQLFCATQRYVPRIHLAMNICNAISLVMLAFALFGHIPLSIAGGFSLVVISLIIIAGYRAMAHSPRIVRAALWLYILSWGICNVGVIIANLAGTSILPEFGDFIATKLGTLFGALQIVMESFALSLYTVQAQRQLTDEKQQRALAENARELEYERNIELAKINSSMVNQQHQLQEQKINAEQANIMLQEANKELVQQKILLEEQRLETERVNTELHERYTELGIANKEKGEFLGIAAHDLKNPLTGLKGMIEILRSGDEIKPAYMNRMALTMQQSVDRMFDIVRNLLDVHTIEQGALQLTLETHDLLTLAKNVCDSYRLPAAHKRITIEFKANAADIPCFVDDTFATQIIDNVLSNALKYSPSQTTITVRTLKVSADATAPAIQHSQTFGAYGIQEIERITANMALLLVQDRGPGLTDEDKTRLFQKFARLSAQPTGGEHSTGLGLSIVKRLVENMHGQVWCESRVGEGATFIVAFPTASA
jgi:two-component system, sensor histidine kinase LadS